MLQLNCQLRGFKYLQFLLTFFLDFRGFRVEFGRSRGIEGFFGIENVGFSDLVPS